MKIKNNKFKIKIIESNKKRTDFILTIIILRIKTFIELSLRFIIVVGYKKES